MNETSYTDKIGDWIGYRSLSSGSYRQGRITKIENGTLHYFNPFAFDGMGCNEEVRQSNIFIDRKPIQPQ